MATDTDRFEDIDWQSFEERGSDIGRTTLIRLVIFGAYFLFLLYDLFVVDEGKDTVPALNWDVTGVDWLFMATLLALGFYVVQPLVQNPRLTAYYWRQFKKNRMAVVSGIYLVVIFAIGTFVPMFVEVPQLNVLADYQPPVGFAVDSAVPTNCIGETANGKCYGSMAHPLGTTGQGKDILMMVIFGMRVSMQVGLIAMLISIVIATAVGTSAAYFGGWVDEVLMRYVDIQLTFPTFFLFLLLVYLFGGSLFLMIVIFGVTGWGGIARLVRSEALQRREEEYFLAAESAGASDFYVIRRHLVPNVSNTVITAATLAIPSLILAEAALSFLGLGDPTIPSWGQVISAGRGNLSDAWWISTIPGLFLFVTIMAFNSLGDALRDALDPRQE